MKRVPQTLLIGLLAPALLTAQSTDDEARALEAERQRLGDQRIRVEMELRVREEQQRLEAAQQEEARAQQAAASEREEAQRNAPSTREPETATPSPAHNGDLSRTLEQLRTLGELKDRGYVTDEEFQRIKRRILDGEL